MAGWARAEGAVDAGPDRRPSRPRVAVGSAWSTSPGRRRPRSGSVTSACPARIPDFHALSVLGAILGGLFNSRLNMKLREEKGYTYGAHAGFDLRRAAGPFSARAAVNTEVTAAALSDLARRARPDPRERVSPMPSCGRPATT